MEDDREDRHAEGDRSYRQEDFDRGVLRLHAILPGAGLARRHPFAQRPVGRLFLMRMMAPDAPERQWDGDGDENQSAGNDQKIVRVPITTESPGRHHEPEPQRDQRPVKPGVETIGDALCRVIGSSAHGRPSRGGDAAERLVDNVCMKRAFAHAARCRESASKVEDWATIKKLCGYPYLPISAIIAARESEDFCYGKDRCEGMAGTLRVCLGGLNAWPGAGGGSGLHRSPAAPGHLPISSRSHAD